MKRKWKKMVEERPELENDRRDEAPEQLEKRWSKKAGKSLRLRLI